MIAAALKETIQPKLTQAAKSATDGVVKEVSKAASVPSKVDALTTTAVAATAAATGFWRTRHVELQNIADAIAQNKLACDLVVQKIGTDEGYHCEWAGATCTYHDATLNTVTALDLSSIGMKGYLSRAIGELAKLTKLAVSDNQIQGQIPTEIA